MPVRRRCLRETLFRGGPLPNKPLDRTVLGIVVVALLFLTLFTVWQSGVIADQRNTIKLLHLTTQPRPCTHGGNGYNAG